MSPKFSAIAKNIRGGEMLRAGGAGKPGGEPQVLPLASKSFTLGGPGLLLL